MLETRWLILRDVEQVSEIDKQWAGEWGWNEEQFAEFLRSKNNQGLVILDDADKVVGYVVYRMKKRSFEIVRIAVAADHRRSGVGRQMIADIKRRADGHTHRNSITISVDEHNLLAQVWLAELGFWCGGSREGDFEFGHTVYDFTWQGMRGCPFSRMHMAYLEDQMS